MIKKTKTCNKILGGIGIAVVIALLVAIPAVGRNLKHNNNTEAYLKEVRDAISNVYKENPYMEVSVNDNADKVRMVYNSNKECYLESMDSSYLYLNNNKAIDLSNYVVSYDLDCLAELLKGIELVENGDAEIDCSVIKGIKQYTIKMNSVDDIKKVYTDGGDKYTSDMISDRLGSFKDTDNTSMTMEISVGESGKLGAEIVASTGTEEHTVWSFDGYLKFKDWEVDSKAYTMDNLKDNEKEEVVNKVLVSIDTQIQEYTASNNKSDIDLLKGVELADLESQSSEEETTANSQENNSEPSESSTDVVTNTVDTANVASNTVESEQSNQNVDTSNDTVVDNSNVPENGGDNGTNDSVYTDGGNSGDTVDVADNSDWNTKIETDDKGFKSDMCGGIGGDYIVHEGDQARHDVGDSVTVSSLYRDMIEMGYTEEDALAELRAAGYNV
ncbi:hypothetical protein KQI85_10800 [Falcatimonas sp. MSJ-15]|uniref:hypothetical protein n=1 Tax=Falcatimonas sp. MSJ-15 TaxID=2841515 RepID=UPI001C121C50|nr:hypothetical protein [Falcatimonas sp. MSJ-15]MBU5470853.1 hypothetical protein [Falcatimonas sp. MSJ-15]